MTTDLRKLAEAATPEAIAKRLRDRALRMEGDPDGVVGNATWLANTAADTIDALTARIRELESSNATAFAAGVEAALVKCQSEAHRYAEFYPLDSDGRNTFLIFADGIETALRALSPSTGADMVMVPGEPTEAMWGNDLVWALIFWQRNDRPTPSKLFTHCKNCGVAVPEWLSGEAEMQDLEHVTSKGTVAVLIYRAMIKAHEGGEQ